MAANVVLARARLAGGVSLEPEAPTEIRVSPGDEILLKLPYRFDDLREKEAYEIRMVISLDDEPEEEVTFTASDRPGLSDNKRGFLVQERTILASGQHAIRFRVEIRLETSGWSGGETQVQEKSLEGTIRVMVR